VVRESPKIVPELYEQFAKFSKSGVQHFHKLERQRKTPKQDEALRPPCYNDNKGSYPKQVDSIDSDGCGPMENWERNFGPPPQQRSQRPSAKIRPLSSQREHARSRSRSRPRAIHIQTSILHGSWQ
jgi:hypothetical protein